MNNKSPETGDGSEKDCKLQWLAEWGTENRWTVGPVFKTICFTIQKKELKNIRGTFFKNLPNRFWKKCRSPMEKGRIEFSLSFHEPGWNSEQNGNVKIFFYINSNCVFFKTFEKRPQPYGGWRRVRLNFRYHFSARKWKFRMGTHRPLRVFSLSTGDVFPEIAYFPRQFHCGAKWVSQ